MPESSGSMYSSILILEKIQYHCFTWSGPNSREILNLFQFSSRPWGPTIGIKFTISSEFGPLQVKWWCHMLSNTKEKEYMESEFSDIFQVQVVTKNILFEYLETQRRAVFAMWCLFLKKHANFLNQTVTFEFFPC